MLARPAHCTEELHETPTGILTALVEEAVKIEGPVHIDEVIERIRSAWASTRAGGRIPTCDRECPLGLRSTPARVERGGDFLSIPGTSVSVRDRSAAVSSTLRRAERLPPSEIAAAVTEVVRANFGATSDQIVQAVSRTIGNKDDQLDGARGDRA